MHLASKVVVSKRRSRGVHRELLSETVFPLSAAGFLVLERLLRASMEREQTNDTQASLLPTAL